MDCGCRVTLHSLKGRSELNGNVGTVVSVEDPTSGRIGVRVDGVDKPLALKPENLDVLPHQTGSANAAADGGRASVVDPKALAEAASSVDSKSLARFVTASSIRACDTTKRLFAAEMKNTAAEPLGGSWCCSTSSLWCTTCAANLAWSGCDEAIADNIPQLLGLPRDTSFKGERRLPGELEAALGVVSRVAMGAKPLGQVVLDNLSNGERKRVREEVRRRGSGAVSLSTDEYTNAWGMSMLAVSMTGRLVSSIANFEALARLYHRCELPAVARDIEASSAKLGATPVTQWARSFDVEENGGRGWLTGLLCGYPVWTTIARYHSGGFGTPDGGH
jgi:hypothetical protein